MMKRTGLWPVLSLWLVICGAARAEALLPAVSIIIDDLGKRLDVGQRVLALPGPIACSFLPQARYTRELARQAHALGKEVMLHLPMDSVSHRPLDEGAVTLDMTEQQFAATLNGHLATVPYVRGVNNHMGSLLTRHPGHMLWLMQAMQRQDGMFGLRSWGMMRQHQTKRSSLLKTMVWVWILLTMKKYLIFFSSWI